MARPRSAGPLEPVPRRCPPATAASWGPRPVVPWRTSSNRPTVSKRAERVRSCLTGTAWRPRARDRTGGQAPSSAPAWSLSPIQGRRKPAPAANGSPPRLRSPRSSTPATLRPTAAPAPSADQERPRFPGVRDLPPGKGRAGWPIGAAVREAAKRRAGGRRPMGDEEVLFGWSAPENFPLALIQLIDPRAARRRTHRRHDPRRSTSPAGQRRRSGRGAGTGPPRATHEVRAVHRRFHSMSDPRAL